MIRRYMLKTAALLLAVLIAGAACAFSAAEEPQDVPDILPAEEEPLFEPVAEGSAAGYYVLSGAYVNGQWTEPDEAMGERYTDGDLSIELLEDGTVIFFTFGSYSVAGVWTQEGSTVTVTDEGISVTALFEDDTLLFDGFPAAGMEDFRPVFIRWDI